MARALCIVLLGLAALAHVNAQQEQEQDSGPFGDPSLKMQVKTLQKNITELWSYIYELRNALSQHLVHLRQHQMQIESTLHDMSHHREDDHHHTSASNQQESHSHTHEDSHNHGDSHTHEDSHNHGDSHTHEDSHSHGDSHEHKDGHGDSHEHKDGHGDSHSHDHHHEDHQESSHQNHHHHDDHQDTSGDHSHGHDDHGESHGQDHHHDHGESHGQDHHHDHSEEHHHNEDSKEKHDNKEQEQQKQEEVAEKVVVATNVRHHHHHHGHDPLNLLNLHQGHGHNHSRMTALPRMSDTDSYNYAICDIKPNTAIASDLQQDVRGQIALWQNKQGGPLGIHVRVSGFSMGSHGHHQQQQHHGHEDTDDQDTASASAGSHKHGFHVHESGDLSNSCQSTGPHYNPKGVNHGGAHAGERHVGDWGNIECDDHGYTNIVFNDNLASLIGPYSILDRAIVIHANQDDKGMNPDDPESLRTGNAGTRIACCVLQRVDRLPSRTYKSMKIAKQYKN